MAQDTAYAAHRSCTLVTKTYRTRNTTHGTGAPVNRSQVAQNERDHTARQADTSVNRSKGAKDTAHATGLTELAHRCTGAKWPSTPHTQHTQRTHR